MLFGKFLILRRPRRGRLEGRTTLVQAIVRGAVFAAAGLASLQIGALAQSGKMYRVGLVSVGAPDSGILGPGMVRDFAKRGYAVDRDIVFERRAAEGHSDRLPSLVDELVADHVDVIITQSYPAAAAAKERAGKIPIVVTNSGDPVATGLAASLAHPGGNVTGVSDVASELSAKRLGSSRRRRRMSARSRCCGTPTIWA